MEHPDGGSFSKTTNRRFVAQIITTKDGHFVYFTPDVLLYFNILRTTLTFNILEIN